MIFGLFLFAFSLVAVIYTVKRLYRNHDGQVTYLNNRVNALKNEIFIYNRPNLKFPDTEIQPVLTLNGAVPTIVVYENSRVAATYKIEPKNNGISLDGTYLHASVRVNANSTVQIDGFISRDKDKYDRDKDEGVRFQPFMLSDREEVNAALKGAGTFERGLHYPVLSRRAIPGWYVFAIIAGKAFQSTLYMQGLAKYSIFIRRIPERCCL